MAPKYALVEAVVDGTPLAKLDVDLKARITSLGLYQDSSGGAKSVSFVGLIGIDRRLYVFVPKCSEELVEDELLAYCAIIFRVLLRYSADLKQISGKLASVYSDSQAFEENLNLLSAYESLMDDWIKNGIWSQKNEKFIEADRGEPLWDRTAAKLTPFISKGVPVYTSFITRIFRYNAQTPMAALHQWTVYEAVAGYGWLKGVSAVELGLLGAPELPGNYAYCLSLIDKAKRSTFDRRKISLLKLIEVVLEKESKHGSGSDSVLGVKYFWPVWEAICAVIYCDNKKVHTDFVPYPRYLHIDGHVLFSHKNFNQNPDIMAGDVNQLILADAKYYDITHTQPGWPDLVKQIFYAKTILDSGYANRVDNRLIFPRPVGVNELPHWVKLLTKDAFDGTCELPQTYYDLSCDFVPLRSAFTLYLGHRQH